MQIKREKWFIDRFDLYGPQLPDSTHNMHSRLEIFSCFVLNSKHHPKHTISSIKLYSGCLE